MSATDALEDRSDRRERQRDLNEQADRNIDDALDANTVARAPRGTSEMVQHVDYPYHEDDEKDE